MKEYNLVKYKANPTKQTQEKVLEFIKKSDKPLTPTSLAKLSRLSFYQVKSSIDFLVSLGILKTIVSQGNITLVLKNEDKKENVITN